jgi:hypothetical protein
MCIQLGERKQTNRMGAWLTFVAAAIKLNIYTGVLLARERANTPLALTKRPEP